MDGEEKYRKGEVFWDKGEPSPPMKQFSVTELTALFADNYEIMDDYVPEVAFAGREGRERLRVLRRVGSRCAKGENAKALTPRTS